jgi:hypothetical protein
MRRPDGGPRLRAANEIQRAHDQLKGLLLGDVPVELTPEVESRLILAITVLCWVLRHEKGRSFAELLARCEQVAEAAGLRLVDTQAPGP